MEGVKAREQEYYRKKLIKEYNTEQLPTISILDLFPDLEEEIQSYSFLSGTSLITDLVLLKSFARKRSGCAYLEIGSWRGESLVNVSDVTEDCTSLTLSADEMRQLNFGEEFIKVHGVFSNHIQSIKRIEANSHTFDFNKLDKKFDLIFIDGDHSYEGVLNDTRKVFQLRKNQNSVIVWHDYGFHTEDARYTTLKAILDGVPKEKHKNLYHVSNTMCAVYIETIDLPKQFTKFPSYPDKKFSLKIKGEVFNVPNQGKP
ncbi:MAG: class I SAM-dependent methyltransferase, partial [Bacteroidales bacterium]|nr:class I SAM-dependent methyltransferase [Bacteroidales bacterium]